MNKHHVFLAACAAAFAASGCSEAVPAPSTGAFTGSFGNSTAAMGEDCGHDIDNPQIGKVTVDEIPEPKTDGIGGDVIVCRVSENGGQFDVEGFMQRGDAAYQILVSVKGISAGATSDSPALGSVTYTSAKNAGKAYASPNDQPCEFWFQTAGTNPPGAEGIAAGRIWASFKCDRLRNASTSPPTSCGLGQSAIAMENCDQ
jgi:hypothetical protein